MRANIADCVEEPECELAFHTEELRIPDIALEQLFSV